MALKRRNGHRMILQDRTTIQAPASRIFDFFDLMEHNYRHWHPDHGHFEWRGKKGVALGNRFYFEETIAGEQQKKEVEFTEVVPNRLLAFAPTNRFFRLFLPRISFEMEETSSGTLFTAQVVVRMGPLAQWMHQDELAAVKRHMREEGENLKMIMEADVARKVA